MHSNLEFAFLALTALTEKYIIRQNGERLHQLQIVAGRCQREAIQVVATETMRLPVINTRL